jgi:hypothetical protein
MPLLSISSLDVVRNVIQVCAVGQDDDVACIGEAEVVKLDGNRLFLTKDPDIDGFR